MDEVSHRKYHTNKDTRSALPSRKVEEGEILKSCIFRALYDSYMFVCDRRDFLVELTLDDLDAPGYETRCHVSMLPDHNVRRSKSYPVVSRTESENWLCTPIVQGVTAVDTWKKFSTATTFGNYQICQPLHYHIHEGRCISLQVHGMNLQKSICVSPQQNIL